MRGVYGALIVAVAALLISCSADPHREQDGSGGEQGPKRYDLNDYRQAEEFEDFLRFLNEYENRHQERTGLGGLGGNSLLGRNINTGGLGGSSLLGRNTGYIGKNTGGLGGSSLLGRNLNGLGGSNLLGRQAESDKMQYARYVDSLGGDNFVRNLDSIGGGNFVRNLDSIGGGNFVKKNLDQLGGPNLVKRNLDSLGGGNFVRNLDSLGGGNFVRHLDPLGGHKNRVLHPIFEANLPDGAPRSPYGANLLKMLDYISRPKDQIKYPLSPMENSFYYGGMGDDYAKRNFDEIDRSNLDTFVAKRNFDEIDRSSMPFPYATKRFYHVYGNYLDLDTPVSSFDKKRYRPDYPMDEIDLSHFPIGSKRSSNSYLSHNLQ